MLCWCAQAYTLHAEFKRIADALLYAFIIGATLSMLAYTAAWLVLLADFRVSVLAARRGEWRFDRAQIRLADASMYVGIQVRATIQREGCCFRVIILPILAVEIVIGAQKIGAAVTFKHRRGLQAGRRRREPVTGRSPVAGLTRAAPLVL